MTFICASWNVYERCWCCISRQVTMTKKQKFKVIQNVSRKTILISWYPVTKSTLMNCNPKLHSKNTCPVLLGRIVFTICLYSWKGRMVGVDNKIVKREDLTRFNHSNYNFFNYDWLLKLLFSTNSLSKLLINHSHQFWVVQWNPFNTDTKWTCHNVRIIRVCVLEGVSEKMSGTHVLSI